jgi:hypothetical protein
MASGSPFGSSYDFGGAIASNKFGWDAGIREIDMHPALVHLTPSKTKTLALLGDTSFDSVSPEWMQVTLASVDDNNAFAEGADYTYEDENVPARIQQVTRIMRKTASVTGSQLKDRAFAAIRNKKKQQLGVRMLELKRDMNKAAINSAISNTNEATARKFRGILESISDASNTEDAQIFNATNLKAKLLRGVWDDNFDPTDLILTAVEQELLDAFTAGHTKFLDATTKEVIDHVNVYDSAYGRINVTLERTAYLATGTVFVIDREYWKIAYFRKTWMEEPPKDGDRWRGVIQNEWGIQDLASGNAGYSLTAVTAS